MSKPSFKPKMCVICLQDFVPNSGSQTACNSCRGKTVSCACGCGKTIPAYSRDNNKEVKSWAPRRFAKGHNGSRERNTNWNGGRKKYNGYFALLRPEHPYANKAGYIYEHRLVAEEILGRYLTPEEDVHHIDFCKTNNDPSNLMVLTKREHHRLHLEYRRGDYSFLLSPLRISSSGMS